MSKLLTVARLRVYVTFVVSPPPPPEENKTNCGKEEEEESVEERRSGKHKNIFIHITERIMRLMN